MLEHPTFEVLYTGFVVRDRCTGLEWEADNDPTSAYYTFADAALACTSKNLPVPTGSAGKWRMPTRLELASILDFGQGGPVLDTRVFKPSLDQFWTSSETADKASAWTWTMYQGKLQVKPKGSSYYGRCVRDSLGDVYNASTLAHVDVTAAGEVRDRGTLLTWEAIDTQNTATRSLASAENYCSGKGTGWRVPTLKELLTIVEEGTGVPPVVPSSLVGHYWTETTVYEGGMTASHWTVHFGTGLPSSSETAGYIRCVK